MSELPRGVARAEPPAPRDSASAIVVSPTAGGQWAVLLGLRSRRSRFMPGHLACPGGGIEAADAPGEPGAYERCASRELLEETGIEVPHSAWAAAGERITPAMFPVRFRTRFFVAELPAGTSRLAPASGENESLRLASPSEVLADWVAGRCRLPPPILPIVRALERLPEAPLDEVARVVAAANAQEERAPRIEFAPDVWMLPMSTATLPPATHTNAWLPGGRRFAIVDPGSEDDREVARLLEVVERRRSLGAEPLAVLLTHHHQDHVAGAGRIAEALELPVRAHVSTLDALAPSLGVSDATPLAGGEEVDLDGMTLRALHTPGHAPGHLAFQVVERSLLIAGDLISGLSTILIDPEQGDMDAYLASLARARACGCDMLLPGHGPPLPGARLAALIEHREERERRIVTALESGTAELDRIAAAAYADTPGLPVALIEGQTLAHLRRLERHGLATPTAAGSWRPAGGS